MKQSVHALTNLHWKYDLEAAKLIASYDYNYYK